MAVFGGIEAGGTKFVCAVGTGPEDLSARTELPTTTPKETIGRLIAFFKDRAKSEKIAAMGIASFGPVDLHRGSPTFGYITSTPKAGWENTDLAGPVRRALDVPVAFDTDVNGAALAEAKWGAARGLDSVVYLTVGTGIGGGAIVEGRMVHGALHPEMGHLRVAHDWRSDPFPGVCPFHGDCWEGLSTGPAIEARWGKRAEFLPPDHEAWTLEAHYLALGVMDLVCALSPRRIILGGGVMRQAGLYPLIRQKTTQMLNGYIRIREITEQIDYYLVPPQLGENSGVLGALALAAGALD
jgi:fructokinase